MTLPMIAVTNQSTVVTDDQLAAVIPALQKQVSNDFKGFWDTDCTLSILPKDQALTSGWWQIVVVDNPDQAGALGYHEMSSQGTPLGKIFAKLDIESGSSWTVTISHELLEMLADPWINWCAQSPDGGLYALEVCDAVEADELGYKIDDVLVSDFVTPSWFEPTGASSIDFKGHVTQQLELALGGYISRFDPNKGWTQVSAEAMLQVNFGVAKNWIPKGSRRHRRTIPKAEWKHSTI